MKHTPLTPPDPQKRPKKLNGGGVLNADSTVTNHLRLPLQTKEQYEQEAALLRSFDHPNILRLDQSWWIESTPIWMEACVVTPYMKHKSLARAIRKERVNGWTPDKKREIISGVASAIMYLHSRDMVVGGLQPDNVLLDKGYRPVLADICQVRVVTSGQVRMEPSVRYEAPEVGDEQYTRKSDIYAFGMIVYCVVTGMVPFADVPDWRLRQKIDMGARPTIPDKTDEFYSRLIRSCWESNPDDRPDIDQVIQDLEHLGKREMDVAGPDIADESTKRVFETGEWLDISKFCRSLDDYEKLEAIGRGSAGKIYKYRFKETGELVAVKKLNSYRGDERSRLLYAREVGILGNIRHPTLLQLHGCTKIPEIGSYDVPAVITMYMSGGCLKDHGKVSALTATEKHIILYGVACGMMVLHSYRIIHRDVKAGNVFLDERNEPRVADFGLSKYVEENQDWDQSMVCGTTVYMAPELINGSEETKFNFKVDVYAFGMLMHYVMTGDEDPYRVNQNMAELKKRVLRGDRPDCENIPEPYSSIIKKCLDPDPMERPEFNIIVKLLESFPEDVDDQVFSQYRKKIQGETSYLAKFEWFELLERVHTSSAGHTAVWKAIDRRVGVSTVALKVYNSQELIDEERFKRELRVVSQFRHPAILPFVGYGTAPPFIATAFMDNGTLEDILKKEFSGEFREKCSKDSVPEWNATTKSKCIFGIVTALAFVHQQGKDRIHGNVRPESVYLDDCFEPCLGNFDCTKRREGEAWALPEDIIMYTAPEIISNHVPTQASDVYSFAFLLYHMFTDNSEVLNQGHGNRRHSQRMQSLLAGFRPDFGPGTPDFYKDLIEACWNRDPKSRPTMTQILSCMATDNLFMLEGADEQAIKKYQQRILPGLRIEPLAD